MYQETLVPMEKVLGKTYKSTLSIINKLVAVFCCQQKYTEAFEMHQQMLTRKERVLGEKHEPIVSSIKSIVEVLCGQQKYTEAVECLL